ncbi:MAG: hypothetical protein H7145_17025 [Akkermansiaceae bacterium]|nr:hypothetical protein [Armatimonadota bacterium]
MPILTIDLPETAYQAALEYSPEERVRLIAATFTGDKDTLIRSERDEQPELSEEDYAAIGRGLEDIKAGRTERGSVVMDRIRAKYGLRKGNSPF